MGAGDRIELAGASIEVLVSSRGTEGRYAICQAEFRTDDPVPLHSHSYEDGFFYVVEGQFEFQIGMEEHTAPKGTSLFIPRRTPYSIRKSSQGAARLLLLSHPGGVDLLFHDLTSVARRGSRPSRERLAPILEKHGITVPAETCDSGRV